VAAAAGRGRSACVGGGVAYRPAMPVTLVTGCSSGFGLLTAQCFARRGHRVVANARDTARAGALERVRDDEDLPIHIEALDVLDDASVAAAVGAVVERHGGIDVLVNNAGLGVRGAVEEVPDADARLVFDTNVFGLLRVTRSVLPVMRAAGAGVVVNVSSVAGRVTQPFGGIYSASKHAVEAISDALHYELRPFGIRVAVVEPGNFPTGFDANRRAGGGGADSPYAPLQASWLEAYGRMPGRSEEPDPAVVAEAIWEVATDPDAPLRRLVGGDAELLGALRKQLDDDEFEHTVRTSLDFWEGFPRS
jgi:NAD(P)-dependent dehydrogenase (short-subunit alcohol dehydrogenase family)